MAYNLSSLAIDERATLQTPHPHSLELHHQELDLAVEAAWEYSRLLSARNERQEGWRDWVYQQLLAMDDPQLVARLTQRLGNQLRGAGQSGHTSQQG